MSWLAGPLGGVVGYDPDREAVTGVGGGSNAGLLLRRLAFTDELPTENRDPATAAVLRATAAALLPRDLLAAAHLRRQAALRRLRRRRACRELRIRAVWRLVVGLGEETPNEVGLRLHASYGVPVLPGSALKGVARAYARDEDRDGYDSEFGPAVFGAEPADRADRGDKSASPDVSGGYLDGRVLFCDALPEPGAPAQAVTIDIVNPHVADYYRSAGAVPPAEYLQPRPIAFLALTPAAAFRVTVLGRGPHPDDAELAAGQAVEWLAAALRDRGVGAKTSAGYGYCTVEIIDPVQDEAAVPA